MANLKKREIVILVIAGLFVLYAGYVYLIAGSAGKKVAVSGDSVKMETSISGIQADLNKSKLSDFEAYVVKKTGADGGKNPFLKKDLYKSWAAKEVSANNTLVTMIYSGYVESGKNRMAIINGLEYRAGEQLKEEGYTLKQITPLKVLIFDKRTGIDLEIPIQE
jgi:hypothetical protein